MEDKDETKEELIEELKTLREEREESAINDITKHAYVKEKFPSFTKNILDFSSVGIFILDSDFKVVWINHAIEKYFGLQRENVIGRDKRNLIRKNIQHIFESPDEFVRKVFSTYDNNTYIENFECHVLPNEKRKERWLEHWSQPIKSGVYAGGRIEHYYNITDRKKVEEKLQDSEEYLKMLFDYAPGAYYISDLKGNFVDGNKAAEKLTGYKVEELIGKNFLKLKLLSLTDIPKAAKLLVKNLRGQPTGPDEFVLHRKDNSKVTVELLTYPIKIKRRTLVLGIARDITARKQAVELLKESEERYHTIFENTGTAIMVIEEDMTISMINSQAEILIGYTKEEIENKMKWTEFVIPEDLERMKKYHIARRKAGEKSPTEYEFRLIDKKGNIKDIFLKVGMISHTKKSIVSLTDITKIIETENKLTYRIELEKLISSISARFVGISLNKINEEINKMLQIVGQFTHIDRAYLFLFSKDGAIMDNTHEWCAPGIKTEIDNLKGLPSSTFPWWMEKLNRNEFIHISCVKDLPNQARAEKEILQSQNIQSLLVVPVVYGKKLIGFIGFDAVQTKKTWEKEDISLLRTLGNIIASTLERQKLDRRINHLNLVLRAIRNVNQLIVKEKDCNRLIKGACESLTKTRDYHNAWIALLDGEGKLKTYAETGLGKAFLPMVELLKKGRLTACGKRALKQQEVVMTRDPVSACTGCPLSQEYSGRVGFTIRLEHGGEVYGLMSVSIFAHLADDQEEQGLFKEVAGDIALGLHSIEMRGKLDKQTHDLQQSYQRTKKAMDATIETMSKIVEAKDPYTAGHQQRVSQLTTAIAKELNLSPDKVEGIRVASLIHDIGKIGLPTEILSKPTRLTDIEFSLIKSHSQIGYDVLKSIDFSYPVANIVLQHHERLDGSGYPNHLKGGQISLEACILGVADVVEAMSSHRPYRPALGIDKALEEISQNKGILYDPEVADTCLKLFKEKGFKFE